jgi:signal transduction histidine kinase
MTFQTIRELVLPGAMEQDEGFRQEIFRNSHAGLKLVGAAQLAYPIVLLLAWLFLRSSGPAGTAMIWQAAASVTIGTVTLALARAGWSYQHSRLLAWLSCWLLGLVLIWCPLILAASGGTTEHAVAIHTTLVMLLAAAAIPFRPLQTLALGVSIGLFYLACTAAAAHANMLPDSQEEVFNLWFILMVTALSTVLSRLVYTERSSNYRGNLQLLHAFQDLRLAQSRVMLSENAASLGRLAAAVSHELNSPLGALKSSVSTLLVVAARQATAPASDQQRLSALQAELRRTVLEAAARLDEIVGRIQRFANLDRAEVQSVDLNGLLRDIALLLEPHAKQKVHLELDLQPVPSVLCRPQQLSAVFSSLLTNAIAAVPENGSIRISTRPRDSTCEVLIQDSGRGIGAAELAGIFDPSFKVAGGRVSTGNWSLFNSRQIIQQYGGELRITSEEGRGTTVQVTLPGQAGSPDGASGAG